MIINVTYDASVATCPDEAAFKACVQGVASFYETQFTNNITINWDIGWGEVDGSPIPSGAGAESLSNYINPTLTYAQIKTALDSADDSAADATADASLPSTNPAPAGQSFGMTFAEAKALGFMSGSATGIDGWSGLDKTTDWVFNTTNTTGSDVNIADGQADAFSFLAHELSEVMGRQLDFSPTDVANQGEGYFPYDLFDYTKSGRSFDSATMNRYFSINGGASVNSNHYFNSVAANGDTWDYIPNGGGAGSGGYITGPSGQPDSYDYEGSVGLVSPDDLILMNVLGYDPTTNFTWGLQVSGAFATSQDWTAGVVPGTADAAILDAAGTTDYTVTSSASETVASLQTASTATLAITGGVFDATGGTGAGKNAGTVAISSGATLETAGAFDNTGSISGAGTLEIAGGAATFSAGSKLTVDKVTQAAGSTASVAETSFAYAGDWTQTGGTLSVGSGDTASFSGTNSFSGTLTGAGTVDLTAGSDALSGATLSVANTDVTGASVTLSDTIADPNVVIVSGKLVVGTAGASLSGAGAVLIYGAADEITGATSTTVLNVDSRLEGEGQLGGGSMELVIGASGAVYSRNDYLVVDTGTTTIDNKGYIVSAGGGGLTIDSPLDNAGYLIAYSSPLTVEDAVTGAGHVEVESTGTLILKGAFNGDVTFVAGATGALELGDSKGYTTGAITGFSKTGANALDLLDIAFAGTTTGVYTGTTTSGVLTVTEGANVAKIHLTGDYLGQTFHLSSGPGGVGTKVVDPPEAQASAASPSSRVATSASTLPQIHSTPVLFAQAVAAFGPGTGRGDPGALVHGPPTLVTAMLAHAA
jgi:hypothetical protein